MLQIEGSGWWPARFLNVIRALFQPSLQVLQHTVRRVLEAGLAGGAADTVAQLGLLPGRALLHPRHLLTALRTLSAISLFPSTFILFCLCIVC